MSSILISIIVVLGLILAVGLLSLSESALATVRRWRLRDQAARGQRGAAAALRLTEHLDRLVPVIRIGAALAVTTAGVYAGFRLHEYLGPAPGESLLSRGLTIAGVVVAMTMATLLLGELLPRKIARFWPERIACGIARPMAGFAMMAGPLSSGLERVTELLARLLGVRIPVQPPITHEEIKGLLLEGTKAGVFEEAEYQIFRRVFRFCERKGRVLMTPRDKVVWIDLGDSPDEIRCKVIGSPYSSFPVCDQSLDNLLGMVQVKDLLAQSSGGPVFQVKGLLTLPAFIYEGTRGTQILSILKKSAVHTAVVLDEYGSVVGLLTLSDILNAVLGELPDGNGDDEAPRSVQARTARGCSMGGFHSMSSATSLTSPNCPLATFRLLPAWSSLSSVTFLTCRNPSTCSAFASRSWRWTLSASIACWSARWRDEPLLCSRVESPLEPQGFAEMNHDRTRCHASCPGCARRPYSRRGEAGRYGRGLGQVLGESRAGRPVRYLFRYSRLV